MDLSLGLCVIVTIAIIIRINYQHHKYRFHINNIINALCGTLARSDEIGNSSDCHVDNKKKPARPTGADRKNVLFVSRRRRPNSRLVVAQYRSIKHENNRSVETETTKIIISTIKLLFLFILLRVPIMDNCK